MKRTKNNKIIKNVVVEKDDDDKYHISIAGECLDNKKNVVGIDISMKHFLVSSEGEKINNPKYLPKMKVNLKNIKKTKGILLIERNID